MKQIISPEHPDLSCELRKEELLPAELKVLSRILETPINHYGVWIKFDGGTEYCDDEKKYADFYPQFGLLVKTGSADDHNFIHIEKQLDDNFIDTDGPGWIGKFIEAIADTPDGSIGMHEFLTNKEYLPKFINECVVPELGNPQVCAHAFNKILVEHIYKCLTSAKYHHNIFRLFAKSDTYYKSSPSFVRLSEIENLFDVEIPKGGMENFAVDYGNFILYFHMDNALGGYNEIKFNRYRYNNRKDEMFFFDKEKNNSLIPYEEWSGRLNNKPVIIFGYDERMMGSGISDLTIEPLLKFLGSHENSGATDKNGNYHFSLLNTYDFTI